MLVKAAWAAAKTPGPLRAFYERVPCSARDADRRPIARNRQGRGLRLRAPLAPGQKLCTLELRAGIPSRRGQRGSTHAYNLKEVRARERTLSERGETHYKQLVADWHAKADKRAGTGAATGVRL
jgi:transposase